MSTISNGTTTLTPTLVLGFQSRRESRNVLIEPIDSPEPYVSLAAARTRTGTLSYLFDDEADSLACEQMHSAPGVFTLFDDDVTSVNMSYVVLERGQITRTLDDETRDAWTVTVDYREVTP